MGGSAQYKEGCRLVRYLLLDQVSGGWLGCIWNKTIILLKIRFFKAEHN